MQFGKVERNIGQEIAVNRTRSNGRKKINVNEMENVITNCAAYEALFPNAVSIATVPQSPASGTYTLIPAIEQGNAYYLLNGIIIAFSEKVIALYMPEGGIFKISRLHPQFYNLQGDVQQIASIGGNPQSAFLEMTDYYQLGVKSDIVDGPITSVRIILPGFLATSALAGFNTKSTKYYTFDGAYWIDSGLSFCRFFGINTT